MSVTSARWQITSMTNDKSHSNELAKLRMRKLRRNRKEQKLKNLRLNLTAEQAELVNKYADMVKKYTNDKESTWRNALRYVLLTHWRNVAKGKPGKQNGTQRARYQKTNWSRPDSHFRSFAKNESCIIGPMFRWKCFTKANSRGAAWRYGYGLRL